MVREAKDRIRKYEAKTDPEILRAQVKAVKPLMVTMESDYLAKMALIEQRAKAYLEANLEASPLYGIDIKNYLLYAREIYKFQSKFSGSTLRAEASLRAQKWYFRGLDPTLLLEVAKLQGVEVSVIPTITLDGNANIDDVLKPKTFYNTDSATKRTGSLELTGDAQPSDVYEDMTFYNTDPKTKLTGTLPKPPTPPASDTFGITDMTPTVEQTPSNYLIFTWAIPLWNGVVTKMYALLKASAGSPSCKAKTALYDIHKFVKIVETTERTITFSTSYEWQEFIFPSPPSVIKNRPYILVVTAQFPTPNYIRLGATIGATNSMGYLSRSYQVFPANIGNFEFSNRELGFYCLYTPTS